MSRLVDPERVPVILAAGETSERSELVTPLDLAERAAGAALSGAPGLGSTIDRVEVVGILAGGGPAPAASLAARLGIKPTLTATTTVGGNTPQWLVGRAADDIVEGRVRAVLIAGAEALRSHLARRPGGAAAPTAADIDGVEPDPVIGDARPGLSDPETAAGLLLPAHVYPLFENALARKCGRTPEEHRRVLGELMSPFTEVAATRPHAWFPRPLSADDISTPSDDNRLTAEPYTKRMNAVIAVDQGAALVVTSLAVARLLGAEDRAVFVWSVADASDVWFPSQRRDLTSSPGIAAASIAALAAAGAGIDDIALLDVYSCFPSAVQIAAAALGVAQDDARGLTVTGGLPYFGGPGNNYCTHSIAALTESLRGAADGTLGLITGLGWYITKHSVGVYGSAPPPRGYRRGDTSADQARIDASALEVAPIAAGMAAATIDAATVVYDRDGAPISAPAIATLDDGRRVVARAPQEDLGQLAGSNITGWRVTISGSPPTYHLETDGRVS